MPICCLLCHCHLHLHCHYIQNAHRQRIATLVSNVLWNLVIFAGEIFLQGYKFTVFGVPYGVKAIRKY